MKIDRNTPFVESSHLVLSVEASDLGFPVDANQWPRSLATPLGNGLAFLSSRDHVIQGCLISRRYRQANGALELIVFND
jgi:hypothetical protein